MLFCLQEALLYVRGKDPICPGYSPRWWPSSPATSPQIRAPLVGSWFEGRRVGAASLLPWQMRHNLFGGGALAGGGGTGAGSPSRVRADGTRVPPMMVLPLSAVQKRLPDFDEGLTVPVSEIPRNAVVVWVSHYWGGTPARPDDQGNTKAKAIYEGLANLDRGDVYVWVDVSCLPQSVQQPAAGGGGGDAVAPTTPRGKAVAEAVAFSSSGRSQTEVEALEEVGQRARTIRALPLFLLCCDYFLSVDDREPIYTRSPWTRLERAALREVLTLTSGGGATKTSRAGHPRMLRMLRDETASFMDLPKRSTTVVSHLNNLSMLPKLEALPPFGPGSKSAASGIWASDVPAMQRSFQLLDGLSLGQGKENAREAAAAAVAAGRASLPAGKAGHGHTKVPSVGTRYGLDPPSPAASPTGTGASEDLDVDVNRRNVSAAMRTAFKAGSARANSNNYDNKPVLSASSADHLNKGKVSPNAMDAAAAATLGGVAAARERIIAGAGRKPFAGGSATSDSGEFESDSSSASGGDGVGTRSGGGGGRQWRRRRPSSRRGSPRYDDDDDDSSSLSSRSGSGPVWMKPRKSTRPLAATAAASQSPFVADSGVTVTGGGSTSEPAVGVALRPAGGIWGFPYSSSSSDVKIGDETRAGSSASGGGAGGGGPGAKSLAALAGLAMDAKDGDGDEEDTGSGGEDEVGGVIVVQDERATELLNGAAVTTVPAAAAAAAAGEVDFDHLPMLVTPTHRERALLGSSESGARMGAGGNNFHLSAKGVKGRPPPSYSSVVPITAGGGAVTGIVARETTVDHQKFYRRYGGNG
ncbi:unnamed protein product, partial [Ectocarpus sp. 12 AP-2014]